MKDIKEHSVFLAADLTKPSGRDFTAGVLRYVREKSHWRLTIAQSPEEFSAARLNGAISSGAHGIITSIAESDEIRKALKRVDLPIVLVGAWHDFLKSSSGPYSLAVVNEEKIGTVGANHLLSLGRFATFGFVHCPEKLDRKTSVTRKLGFRKTLRSHGYDCKSFDRVADASALARWLCALPKPAGILAGHDVTAKMVLDACHHANIKVPGEISILGIDNDVLLCDSVQPALSSIHIDSESLGFAAAAELARLLKKRRKVGQPKHIVETNIKVVERETTRPVAPATYLIEKAMSFITANRENAITVKDVVNHLGVSKRLVYLRFEQYAGESVLQAITRTRLEAAALRIRKYSVSISKIIKPLGFPDVSYFSALFKRQFGLSPAAYRKQGNSRTDR